jgi:antitoxin (DNA-binding transcriptional repressor) of toxin-antitoxin stability system
MGDCDGSLAPFATGQMTSPCYREPMRQRTVSVTEFKAKCLSLLDDIGEHGGTLTITKRGRPLATVGPARRTAWKSPLGILEGEVSIDDDLLLQDHADLWEAVSGRPRVRK